MKTISLKVPESLDQRLDDAAAAKGLSKSGLVREAVEAYLGSAAAGTSFLTLAGDLAGIVEGPADLSTNPRHLVGYGR